MIRYPRGENSISWLSHSPLIILLVHVTFTMIKCGRGLAKISLFCKTPIQGLTKERLFFKMHQMTDFDEERFMI